MNYPELTEKQGGKERKDYICFVLSATLEFTPSHRQSFTSASNAVSCRVI